MQNTHDIDRALRLWRVWVIHRMLLFCLGLGLILGVGAVLLRLWFFGIPIAVGSMLLYDLGVRLLRGRG